MRLFLLVLMGACSTGMCAQPSSMVQTKAKLQHLNMKIVALKQQLITAQANHQEAGQVVTDKEKKINHVKERLNHINLVIQEKQAKINQLSAKVQDLSQQLHQQQAVLADYLRMRFSMGKDFTLKGLINIDSIQQLNRWLIFSQYIIASHQQLIVQIMSTQAELKNNQKLLKQELLAQASLKKQLHGEYHHLEQEKASQLNVLTQLVANIKTNQQTLTDYERDKNNLNALLQRLVREAEATTHIVHPLSARFRSSFTHGETAMRAWNQGLLFKASEGSPVKAVQAGKVVFSDWLRGYGYLVIVDHGHGLMTLYGYNQSLYKHQGENVVTGEQIAAVGHSGNGRESGLYFEVRKQGKVVAASAFLKTKTSPVPAPSRTTLPA